MLQLCRCSACRLPEPDHSHKHMVESSSSMDRCSADLSRMLVNTSLSQSNSSECSQCWVKCLISFILTTTTKTIRLTAHTFLFWNTHVALYLGTLHAWKCQCKQRKVHWKNCLGSVCACLCLMFTSQEGTKLKLHNYNTESWMDMDFVFNTAGQNSFISWCAFYYMQMSRIIQQLYAILSLMCRV